MSSFGRVPCIVLDYNKKELAKPEELIINYDTGDIYIASKADPSILIDVTAAIKEQLKNLDGDGITLEIEDIGKIGLNQMITELIISLDTGIGYTDEGSQNLKGYEEYDTVDSKSIESKNKNIQLKGFDTATELTIPRKSSNGLVEWVAISDIIKDGDPTNIDPENPTDGQITKVDEIPAINNKIYLRPDQKQATTNPQNTNLLVVLPVVLDEYAKVEWLMTLGNNIPTMQFTSNVVWEYDQYFQPQYGNKYYLYTFETYDYGKTWIAKFDQYQKNASANDAENVKQSYLDQNYYTKQNIDSTFDWKTI